MNPELELVRRRREEMAVEENNLRVQLDRLVAEREELQRIEGYLTRLVKRFDVTPEVRECDQGASSETNNLDALENEASSVARRPRKAPTPRPEGLPTLAEMMDAVLADAERQGRDGLESVGLLKAINDRYWPGVVANSVLPTAHRHVKMGRLARKGPLFVRIAGSGGLFRDEAADNNPRKGPSTASVQPEAQGREAGPGGGG